MGTTHEGVEIIVLTDTGASCQAMAYTVTLEQHWESDAHARPNFMSDTARHNVCLIYPHSFIRVMVPNSPRMTWVDPGEGIFTCQVNRRDTGSIELGPPRWKSRMITTIPLLYKLTEIRRAEWVKNNKFWSLSNRLFCKGI
eukprot:TCONS_00057277-protein